MFSYIQLNSSKVQLNSSKVQLNSSKEYAQDVNFRVVSGRSGLEEIAWEWNQITQAMEQKRFFHLIDWYRCYLDALEKHPEQVFFCLIYSGNQPEAIIPLRKTSRRILGIRMNVLELPNHSHLSLGDFVATGKDKFYSYLPRLLKELRQLAELRWDYLYFPNVLQDSLAIHAFTSLPSGFNVIKQQVRECDYLVVAPYEKIFQSLPRKLKSNLRRAQKREADSGCVNYTSATVFPQLEQAYIEFLDVEASGWKGGQGMSTAIKLDTRLTLFYRKLIERYSKTNSCEIHIMKYNEKPIAAAFTLITGDTCYRLKVGFDEEYARLSPGNMLHQYLLKRCGERAGEINYINMISGVPWHNQWRPLKYEVFDLYIYGSTLRGRLIYIRQQLPRLVRFLMSFVKKPSLR